MKNKMHKIIALTLAVCFLFIFAGCSTANNNDSAAENQKNNKNINYKAYDIDINAEIQNLSGNIASNNGLFYSGYKNNSVIIFDELGNIRSTVPVAENSNENEQNGIYTNIFTDSNGNITCMTGKFNYISDEAESYDKIVRFDTSGNKLSSIDLSKVITRSEIDKGLNVIGFVTDDSGNIYLNLQKCVKVLDSSGNVLFTTKVLNSEIKSFIMTNSNIPAINIFNNNENKLIEIDINAKNYGKEYTLPSDITEIYQGTGDYICCTGTSTGIAGIKADTLKKEEILNFLNIGVDNSQIDCLTICGDGSFIIKGIDSSKYVNPIKVTRIVPVTETNEKKILTLGCFTLDWELRSQIVDFNKKNNEYSVYVNCYSDTNDMTDLSVALENFNMEIISGNVPDILMITSPYDSYYDSYTSKGLFTDRYEVMKADSELTKERFLPNIINALETDGKLYSICADFTVYTCAVKKDIMNGKNSMTMEEAKKYLSKLEKDAVLFDEPFTSEAFVNCAVRFGNFVDYGTASCCFDDPKFKRVLEYAKEFPSEIDYEKLRSENPEYRKQMQMYCSNGMALLSRKNLGSYNEYNITKDVYFKDDITFIGFPGIDEEIHDNGKLVLGTRYAISDRSEYKEGAWQFIKSVIKGTVTEHNIPNYSDTESKSETEEIKMFLNKSGKFPVLSDNLNKLAAQASMPNYYIDTEGKLAIGENSIYINGAKIVLEPLSNAETEEFTAYIKSVSQVGITDINIENIINEETSFYFGGAKSADETASVIQSRVSLYLNEQYN